MNHDNIVAYVPRIQLQEKTSKSGNPYHQLKLEFINGYTFTAYVNPEQVFAVKDALKQNANTTSLLDPVDDQPKLNN